MKKIDLDLLETALNLLERALDAESEAVIYKRENVLANSTRAAGLALELLVVAEYFDSIQIQTL